MWVETDIQALTEHMSFYFLDPLSTTPSSAHVSHFVAALKPVSYLRPLCVVTPNWPTIKLDE